jgi:hypothetical protein
MVASSTPFVEIAVTPDFGPRKRLSVFFRGIVLIPFLVLVTVLSGSSLISIRENEMGEWDDGSGMGSALWFGLVLVILFSASYPKWILTFMHGLQSFAVQIGAFGLLLRDELPAVEYREYAQVLYPDIEEGRKLNRFLPLVKWLLALPHYLWLFITFIGVFIVTLLAWFSILFTGRYPQGNASFVIGWLAYYQRVIGYAFTLVTDKYPSFSLR